MIYIHTLINLSNYINDFIREFSDEEKKISDIGTAIINMRHIADILRTVGTNNLIDFYRVEQYFTDLAKTSVGKYFIKYFVSDDIDADLSKNDFYKISGTSKLEDDADNLC